MRVAPALLVLLVLCLIPLVLGMESILLMGLPGGLPLGTLLAAVAIISASLIPVMQSKSGSIRQRIALLLLVASILWLPIGIYLSGNAALNFVQDAADARLFWQYTAILCAGILLILVWTGIEFIRGWRAV